MAVLVPTQILTIRSVHPKLFSNPLKPSFIKSWWTVVNLPPQERFQEVRQVEHCSEEDLNGIVKALLVLSLVYTITPNLDFQNTELSQSPRQLPGYTSLLHAKKSTSAWKQSHTMIQILNSQPLFPLPASESVPHGGTGNEKVKPSVKSPDVQCQKQSYSCSTLSLDKQHKQADSHTVMMFSAFWA